MFTLLSTNMKANRAQDHYRLLEHELANWIKRPPYSISNKDDVDAGLHICRIEVHTTPEIIPQVLGDFVCCLRSSLDHLAWALAHLDESRVFSKAEIRNIFFPISKVDDKSYRDRLALYPALVASEIDKLQPYHRGADFGEDPLWQLNKLWTIDKHNVVPINSSSFDIGFPLMDASEWAQYLVKLDDALEVRFPLSIAWRSKAELKPHVSMQVLFGEHMGDFSVTWERLGEIDDFVVHDVIPRFKNFFS